MSIYKELIEEITGLPYGETVKIVFSVPKAGARKAALRPVMLKEQKAWQCEKTIGSAVFHENIPESGLRAYLERLLEENGYRQIHIITADSTVVYRLTKKSKLHRVKTPNKTAGRPYFGHDRVKEYLLTEGMPVQPLVDLGVFTQDFRVVRMKYSKFRQINNFLKNIESGLHRDFAEGEKLDIVEFGCGKSYLTFVLYYYFTFLKKMDVKITGYDKNGEVIGTCNNAARKYGYVKLSFVEGDISEFIAHQGRADMVITLHACDTATDYALRFAIASNVKYIFCVPCCQHEVNAQIKRTGAYAVLLRHGLYKERFSALLTDCIRCEVLNGAGYAVDVVEFVGEENTPKNAMIRARYTGRKKDNRLEIADLMAQFGAEHTLLRLMGGL